MQRLVIVFTCVNLLAFITGCQSTFSPQVENLLAKMRTKVDPQGKLEKTESKIVNGVFRRNSKDKGATISIKIQSPDMLRYDIVIPGEESLVKAFDGKKSWEYSTKRGYRELTGYELRSIKFQAALLNPQKKAEQIFSNITFDGEAKVMGQTCFKLICQPKKEFDVKPITLLVDKKTYLLRKRIEQQGDENTGFFTVKTILHDYKSFDGILVPQTIVSYVNGDVMEYDVTSVKWNEKIPINAFDPPEVLE